MRGVVAVHAIEADDDKGSDAEVQISKDYNPESAKIEAVKDKEIQSFKKEEKGKEKEVIISRADVGQPTFTAEQLYLETAKHLSERYPDLVAKETLRVNSSLDRTFEEERGR